MPLDSRIPLGVQPLQLPSPLEIYSTVQQIAGQREAVEARRLAAEEARERRADAQAARAQQAALDRALQAAMIVDPKNGRITFDRQKLLAGVPAAVAYKLQQELDTDEVSANTLAKSLLDLEGKKREYRGSIGQTSRAAQYDPNIFRPLMRGAHGLGALDDALATQYEALEDPAAIQPIVDDWIAQGGDETKLQKVTKYDPVSGQTVETFVAPTEGAEFLQPPKTATPPAAPSVGSFEDYVVRRYGATPTPEQITQARKDYQQADDRPTVTVNTPRPITQTAEAGLITRLNTQWTTASKGQRELAQQLSTMRSGLAAAERGDMAQGTEAVLQPFLKILDPNSVVREGEFFRLREGQSYIARAQGIMQRLTQGGFVPVDELKKYAALAEEIATRQDAYVAAVRARIGGVADRYNIPNELVFETEAPAPTDTRAVSPPATVAANPKEGDVQPIPGIPGAEAEYRGGTWIRVK